MSEANLWDRLRDGLMSASEGQIILERIENAVGVGTADVNGLIDEVEFWLELKFISKKPARDGPVFGNGGLRPEQKPWLFNRSNAGGQVFIFAQIEKALVLVDGIWAKEFNDLDIESIGKIARWKHYGNMSKSDWVELLMAIKKRSWSKYP
jgi:hypothetical protein